MRMSWALISQDFVFVGVVALCYQHHTAPVLCGVDNGVSQLPQT